MRVSIIGTAGRVNGNKMNISLYEAMADKARVVIDSLPCERKDVTLVSGGAAWSDHIAVVLWLVDQDFGGLHLYLPCGWDSESTRFFDNGKNDWRSNPGRTANKYHQKFSYAVGENTLQHIEHCRNTGATIDCSHFGFHSRNALVAESEVIIAFSWSSTDHPNNGGTKNTWNQAVSSQRIHVPLNQLQKETQSCK